MKSFFEFEIRKFNMAGHSKWKNIQARKGSQDKKRGKIFTKIATEITVAARISGGDPETNPRLRHALIRARSVNMPKDNIDRAVKKGTGALEGVNYVEKSYEGYGPGGVAFFVECLTDNINRTVGEVRHSFTRNSGNLGTDGSVAWMFHKKGQFVFQKTKINLDQLLEIALENGAEDIRDEDPEIIEVLCEASQYHHLREVFEKYSLEPEVAEITRIPENFQSLTPEQKEILTKLVDALEDNDDVQNVYHNASMDE